MPLPADFFTQVSALQAGALQYAAATRQQGQSAEALIPALIAWVQQQSPAPDYPTIVVVGVQEQVVSTNIFDKSQSPVVKSSGDVTDIFMFNISVTFPDSTQAAMTINIPRASLEG